MKHFNKILCPYDFSEHANEALLYAIKLADADTLILLINAIQLPNTIDPYGFVYYQIDSDELKKSTQESMAKKIAELKSDYPTLKFESKIELENDPATYICDIQVKENFDLIVIGSHGRKGLGRILLGSIAESVMRETNCPVVVVKKNN